MGRVSSTSGTSFTSPLRSYPPLSRGRLPGRPGQGLLQEDQGNSATSPLRETVPRTVVPPGPPLPTRLEQLGLDLPPWSSGEDSAGESPLSDLEKKYKWNLINIIIKRFLCYFMLL